MGGKIFISYRRGDDPGHTGRLFDHLQQSFQPEQLFMDVDSVAPGLDFVRVLEEQVGQCDVVLAMIGPRWVNAVDQHGSRRLDDPNDFVRIEIQSALQQDKRVIPVLVGETRMPRLDELPEVIRPLARRNAVRLTHERFRTDAHSLVKALQQALDQAEALRQAHAEAAQRAQTEAERKREEEVATERAKAQREAEEQARREKEQARLKAISGLSAEQIGKAEELANWDFIKASESAQEFRDHLARFPHGVTERMARARLESLMWSRFSARPDLHTLRSFLDEFPDGRYVADAKARLADLERQDEEEERRQHEAGKKGQLIEGDAASAPNKVSVKSARPVTRRWAFLASAAGSVMALLIVGWIAVYEMPWMRPEGSDAHLVDKGLPLRIQPDDAKVAAARAEEERNAKAAADAEARRKAAEADQQWLQAASTSIPPAVLITRKNLPVKDLKELIAYARANPGKLSYGSTGAGSSGCVQLGRLFGDSMTNVPYRGTGPAVQDLAAGNIDSLCDVISSTVKRQIDVAAIKAIAILSKERSKELPNVPTVLEQGP